jgi:hypothetical protein
VSGANRVVGLEFTVGQVCKIAAVGETRLAHWTWRAGIPTHGDRMYDLDAVEMVMLIKNGRDLGVDLTAAIDAAREFQAARPRGAT